MSSSEFITIISGEDLASAQTTADMDLETLLAGAKLDLPLIRNQEIVDLGVIHNGRQFQAQPFLKRKIAELGINGGDVIYVMPMAQKRSQSGSRTSQPSAALERALPGKAKRVAELISQIKVGAKRAAPTDSQGSSSSIAGPSNEEQVYRKQMEVVFRNLHESETHREYLRGEMPEIFEAWETHKDSLDEFQKAAVKCREDMYRKQRLAMEDPTNVEAQQYIAELIRKTNVIESENYAKEFMPETLIQIHMLYIRIVVNQVPIVAFIDTGAQVSIMSVSCAERCNLMRLLDTRYRSEAIGVGGRQKFQGRLHASVVSTLINKKKVKFESTTTTSRANSTSCKTVRSISLSAPT
ncbi:hypothetical protein L596_014601 [Steinernema carpocapsae]|uniref:Aspartic peptidase DDI1-type domain-containing protein n=1 Tax=Steinernema carpocapsae TaxID=34508 RepID=A0A4U5NDA2_STECR|nr:hypothetical protein L596_014601 [Steinernema carpocapsae]